MTPSAHFTLISLALILLLFASRTADAILDVYHDAEIGCQADCQEKNLATPLPRGELSWGNDPFVPCNFSCRVEACQTGCAGLRPSTDDCEQRCSTAGAEDSCRQGCRAALDNFLRRIQDVLNNVQAASSFVQGQGLRVDWTFEQQFSPVIGQIAPDVRWYTHHRPVRSESPTGWEWTAIDAQGFRGSPLKTTVFLPQVDEEETEIRLALSFQSHVVVSKSSIEKIDATSLPARKPVVSTSVQIRDDQYLICWDDMLISERTYTIILSDAEDKEVSSEQVESRCFAFKQLTPGSSYRVTITDSRTKDDSLAEKIQFDLLKLDTAEKKSESLLLANSTHVFFISSVDDYILSTAPVILPLRLPENEKITAIAAASVDQFFVGTSQGKIFKKDLSSDDPVGEEIGTPSNGVAIKQLVIDFMQEKLYALSNDQVVRCDFLTCSNETTSTIKGVAQLAVDSWNGYIYYLNTQGLLFAQPLFPLTNELAQLTDTPLPQSISLPSSATAITVDYSIGQLVITIQNGSAYGYDLVDHSLVNIREGRISKQSYQSVVRLVAKNDRLFYSSKCSGPSGICLYSEEKKPETNAKGDSLLILNKYLYSGELVDISWLGDFERPVTAPLPAHVGLITTATSAKVTWDNPKLLPFQAQTDTWRKLVYKFELYADGSEEPVEQFIKITRNEQLINSVSSGVGYFAKVRACWNSVCSSFVNSSSTAFAPYQQENPVIAYTNTDDKIQALGILGEKLTSVVVSPEKLPKKSDESVVFDPLTGNIYRSSVAQSIIEWTSSSGRLIGSMNSAGVRWLSLMPNRAILVAASSYSVVAYRLLGTIEQQFYSCGANITDCAEVVGMATDDTSGEVFFLIQGQNGSTQLFTADQDVQLPYLVATVTDFPRITQLLVVKEKLMFVTKDGNTGFCDKALGNININYATKKVVQIALNLTETDDQVFDFDGAITMGNAHRNEIKWYVKPQFVRGKILYKIALHRDSSDQDLFVDANISHQYYIPSDLLDRWDSKQKFDVVIDAITPWTHEILNRTGLFGPSKPPSVPKTPKLFVTQQQTPDGPRAFIQFAWQEPTEWNGQPFGYRIKCSEDDVETHVANVTRVKMDSFSVKSGAQVACQVAATNEPFELDIIGPFTEAIKADSNNLNPLIKLFAIDSTDSLVEVDNWLTATGKLRKRRQAPSATQAVDFIDDKLFAIRKESASQQLFLVQMSTVDVNTLLLKVLIQGDIGQVFAMASDWVANRLLLVGNGNMYQIDLDNLKSVASVTPRKLMALSSAARDAKDLLFDPFTNTAYILSNSSTLIAVDLRKSTEENLSTTTDCLKEKPLKAIAAEFVWNSPKSPFIYAMTSTGLIRFDSSSKKCSDVKVDLSKLTTGIDSVSSLSLADKEFVFGTPNGISVFDSTSQKISDVPAKNAPFQHILAVSPASQPYPARSCFELPPAGDIDFSVRNRGRSGAIVSVTAPIAAQACQELSLPQTEYEVFFNRRNSDKKKHVTSFDNTIKIDEGVLDLDADYEVAVTWSNRFSPATSLSRTRPLTTGFGYPSAPQSLQAYTLSPDTIIIFWNLPDRPNAPLNELRYRITLQTSTQAASAVGVIQYSDGKFATSSSPNVTCAANPCQAKIPELKPSTEYTIWITAIHKDAFDLISDDAKSNSTKAKTRDLPGTLTADKVSGTELLLKWTTLNDHGSPEQIMVQYKESGVPDANWLTSDNGTFDPKMQSAVVIKLDNLRSATTYDYRYTGNYNSQLKIDETTFSISQTYDQPAQQIRTKSGVPSAPQNVRAYPDVEGWIVKWKPPANDGGASLLSFVVEFRSNESAEWRKVAESLPANQTWWRPQGLHPDKDKSEFRVAAMNSEGVGAYGSSKEVPEIQDDGDGSNTGLVVAAVVLILLLVVALCIGGLLLYWRRNKKRMVKTQAVFSLTPMHHSIIDSERPAARMPLELTQDLKNLPHVPKSCVNLVRMLGKGSFGEVFEGLAYNLPRIGSKSLRVAVKTLKTGYSEDDRVKFLKEAILMNNFNHPNIVKLLGVCFETEPHYLILELMEGGDLLSFLRSSRPNDSMPSQLSLKDLVGMMIDVGRGGAYLEQHKHVHRDLAARNCLISTRDPQLRVTKIADFGLARDVYSNDYYRVNGQDFLPLRWMSPESTQDGVFTSKTDVWSFGILLWEIMTLGQQPYPGMHNMQVMSFVKNGGHPEKPVYCPAEIFDVIEQTWITDVEKRPSFAALKVQLEALKLRPEFVDDSPFPPSPVDHGSHLNSAFEHSESPSGSNSDSARVNNPPGGSARFERHGKDEDRASKKQGRPSILRSLRKQKPKPIAPPSNAELRERLSSVGSSRHSAEKTGSNSQSSRPQSAFSSGGESFTTVCDDYEVPLTKGMTNHARNERLAAKESSSTPPTTRANQDKVVASTPPPSSRTNQRTPSTPEWGGDNPAYSPTGSQEYYSMHGRPKTHFPGDASPKSPGSPSTSSKVQLAGASNRLHPSSNDSMVPPKTLPVIRRPKSRAPPPPTDRSSSSVVDEGVYAEISSPEAVDSNRNSESALIKSSPDNLGVDNAAFERRSSRVSQV